MDASVEIANVDDLEDDDSEIIVDRYLKSPLIDNHPL